MHSVLGRKKKGSSTAPIRGTVLKNNSSRVAVEEKEVSIKLPVVISPKYRYVSFIISISMILMFLGALLIMRSNFQTPPDMADREAWAAWESEVRMWNYWGRVSVGFGALILGMLGAYGITGASEDYRMRLIYGMMACIAALILALLVLSVPYPL